MTASNSWDSVLLHSSAGVWCVILTGKVWLLRLRESSGLIVIIIAIQPDIISETAKTCAS